MRLPVTILNEKYYWRKKKLIEPQEPENMKEHINKNLNKIQVLHASVVEWLRFIIINCLI